MVVTCDSKLRQGQLTSSLYRSVNIHCQLYRSDQRALGLSRKIMGLHDWVAPAAWAITYGIIFLVVRAVTSRAQGQTASMLRKTVRVSLYYTSDEQNVPDWSIQRQKHACLKLFIIFNYMKA